MPRLGYKQALWGIVHRMCRLVWKILHDKVCYVEQGAQRDPEAAKQRAKVLARQLRRLGYNFQMTPMALVSANG
jgi:hypothetical protein